MTTPNKNSLRELAKKENAVTLAAIVCTLLVAAIFAVYKASKPEPAPSPSSNSNSTSFMPLPRYIGIGAFTTQEWDDAPANHHLLVRDVFTRGPARQAGLQIGDRITHVDDRRVNPEGHPFRSRWLEGDLDETLKVTLDRPREDGDSETLILDITLDWVHIRHLEKARMKHRRNRDGPGIVLPRKLRGGSAEDR